MYYGMMVINLCSWRCCLLQPLIVPTLY